MKAGSTGGATEPGHGHLGSSGEEGDGAGLLRPGDWKTCAEGARQYLCSQGQEPAAI